MFCHKILLLDAKVARIVNDINNVITTDTISNNKGNLLDDTTIRAWNICFENTTNIPI